MFYFFFPLPLVQLFGVDLDVVLGRWLEDVWLIASDELKQKFIILLILLQSFVSNIEIEDLYKELFCYHTVKYLFYKIF